MHSNRLDHSLMFHERQYRVCIFACWEDTFAQWHKRHKLTDTRKGQEERTSLSMGLQHLTSPEKTAGSGGSQASTPSEEAALFTQQSALGSHTFLSLERNFYPFILKNVKTMLINTTRKKQQNNAMKANLKGSGRGGSKVRTHSKDLWWQHSEVPSACTSFNQRWRGSIQARLGALKSHCCWRSPWGLGAPRERSALTRSLLWQHVASSTISLSSPSCLWWRSVNVQTCTSSFLEKSIKRPTSFRTT